MSRATDEALAAVTRATVALTQAEDERDAAIRAAHDAGAQVTAIAEAAALSRPTVYSIIRRAQAQARQQPPPARRCADLGASNVQHVRADQDSSDSLGFRG